MKHKNIMAHFTFATVFGILINIALAFCFGDPETGLMQDGTELFWYIGTAATLLFGGTVFLVATKSVRQPINFVCESHSLGIVSMSVAALILFNCITSFSLSTSVLDTIYLITSIVTIVAFVIISIAFIRDYEVPRIIHVIPSIYVIVFLIKSFVRYSDTKPLCFNLLFFVSVAFWLFFFIVYGKLMCDVNKKALLRRILPVGLTAAYFMLVTAIYDCVLPLLSGSELGVVVNRNYLLGAFGVFAYLYVKRLYKSSNIKHTIERKGDTSYLIENAQFVTYVPVKDTREAMFKPNPIKKSRRDVEDSGFVINNKADKNVENDTAENETKEN